MSDYPFADGVGMIKIKRVLITVLDKTNIALLAQGLHKHGIEILSTGGTGKAIAEAGVAFTPVEQVTNFPEMMDGRVKILHPRIFGGILADRDVNDHLAQLIEHGGLEIDAVICNFYDFEGATSDPDCTSQTATKNMDVGGPSSVCAAIKNRKSVVAVFDPSGYQDFLDVLDMQEGCLSYVDRLELVAQASQYVADYAQAWATWIREVELPRAQMAEKAIAEDPVADEAMLVEMENQSG